MLHVAVVHAPDGILHVDVAPSRRELDARMAAWVARRAADALPPADAAAVRALIAAGADAFAVARYFASVGARWDPEALVVTAVAPAAADAG